MGLSDIYIPKSLETATIEVYGFGVDLVVHYEGKEDEYEALMNNGDYSFDFSPEEGSTVTFEYENYEWK